MFSHALCEHISLPHNLSKKKKKKNSLPCNTSRACYGCILKLTVLCVNLRATTFFASKLTKERNFKSLALFELQVY